MSSKIRRSVSESVRVIRSVRLEGWRSFLHPNRSDITMAELAARYATASSLTRVVVTMLADAGDTRGDILYATLSRGVIDKSLADNGAVDDACAVLRSQLGKFAPFVELVTVEEKVHVEDLDAPGSGELLIRLNAPGHKDRTDFVAIADGAPDLEALAARFAGHHGSPVAASPLADAAWASAARFDKPQQEHPHWRLSLAAAADLDLAWLRIDIAGFLALVTEHGIASWRRAEARGAAFATWFAAVPAMLWGAETELAPAERTLVLHALSDDIVAICPRFRAEAVSQHVKALFASEGRLQAGIAPITRGASAADISRAAHRALACQPMSGSKT